MVNPVISPIFFGYDGTLMGYTFFFLSSNVAGKIPELHIVHFPASFDCRSVYDQESTIIALGWDTTL